MGGFDWDFTFDQRDLPVVKAMIGAGRRRARQLGLYQWRSRVTEDPYYCYVCIDGNWSLLDLLVARLERDLPIICEAVEDSHRSPANRRGLGRAFAHIAAQRRFMIDVDRPEGWVPHLRSRSQPPWATAPHILECEKAPDLQVRLAITERLLVDWHFDEVAPEVLLEELHTAFELTLARVVYGRYRRDRSFQDLIDAAADAGHLCSLRVAQFLPNWEQILIEDRGEYDRAIVGEYVASMLTSLKDARKQAKHQGRETAQQWLQEWFYPSAAALEDLVERAWTKEGWSP